jgi:hypothetical protein
MIAALRPQVEEQLSENFVEPTIEEKKATDSTKKNETESTKKNETESGNKNETDNSPLITTVDIPEAHPNGTVKPGQDHIVAKPGENVTKPAENVAKPGENVTKPAETNATKAANVTQPPINATQPNATQPNATNPNATASEKEPGQKHKKSGDDDMPNKKSAEEQEAELAPKWAITNLRKLL